MPRVVNKFKALRCRLTMMELRQEDLADLIGMSRSEVSNRMAGRSAWRMQDVYQVCRALGIDNTEIAQYFPADEVLECCER